MTKPQLKLTDAEKFDRPPYSWRSDHQRALETFPAYQYAINVIGQGMQAAPLAKHWAMLAEWQLIKQRRQNVEAVIWRIKHGRYMDAPEHFAVAILGEDGRIGVMSTRPDQTDQVRRMWEDFQYAAFATEPLEERDHE